MASFDPYNQPHSLGKTLVVVVYIFFTYCPSSYARMYKDVRAAVDLCHRDGTLKQMVAKDPRRYAYKIPTLSK